MTWTTERVELLKKLWAEGLSASQMAARLGGITRNSCIGKVHRLGLSGRAQKSGIKTRRRVSAQNARKAVLRAKVGANPSRSVRKAVQNAGGLEAFVARVVAARPLVAPVPLPTPREDLPPVVARLKFADLEPHHCRMPVGDPQHADFGFCAEPVALGKPYCPTCCQRAYSPAKLPVKAPHHPKPNTAPASLKRLLQTA